MKIKIEIEPIPNPVYVSFSGGADSTALLLAALENGLPVLAVHFEHGIREGESRDDAAWCRAFCAARNIAYLEIPLNVPANKEPGENLEAAARRLRREAWCALTKGANATILLGHHADDRVENMLIRLARGSNASGAASMDFAAYFRSLTFLRPLLEYRREELEQYLRDAGVTDWRTDATNTDDSYQRNFLRQMLAEWYARFPPSREGLLHAVKALTLDSHCLNASAARAAMPALSKDYTPLEYWRGHDPALVPRLLRIWLESRSGRQDFIPGRHLIERFEDEIHSESTEARYLEIDAEYEICISRDEVWLKPRAPWNFEPKLWNWREKPEFLWFTAEITEDRPESGVAFDAALLPDVLEITRPEPGDAMVPFGKNSPKKLQKMVLDAKLPPRRKFELLAVRIPGGEIIWVPGLRRSNFAPVTEQTREAAVFRFHR